MKTLSWKMLLLVVGLLSPSAWAEIKQEKVVYKQGDAELEGVLVHNTRWTKPHPGVVIVHQWKGITPYELKRAEMLVELGYTVFVADIYGKGIRPATTEEAGQLAGRYKSNRPLLRARVNAALDQLRKQPHVRQDQIAAIGYCFGGTTVLELARSGAPIAGVVSFHGGLSTPTPQDAQNIRCKLLVLHGADDPFVPAEEVKAFQDEIRQAHVDSQFVAYSGAVHSFTHWDAGSDASKGAAYHEPSDRRSWVAMKAFFAELFGPSSK